MAANFPILQIAEPCNQSWEQMPGSARIRHCSSCNQDVVNLAAMSSAEIARLLAGPVSCLRIARYDDGSLITTEPPVARSLPRMAAGLLTAAMALGAAAQTDRPQRALLGAPALAPQPRITGRVTDQAGRPVGHATATLLQHGKPIATVKLGLDGSYLLTAPAGHYDLRVEAPASSPADLPVTLSPDKPLTLPVALMQRRVTLGRTSSPPTATMGMITPVKKVAAPKPVQP